MMRGLIGEKTPLPLCVDLDGTLILTDILQESLLIFLFKKPYMIFHVLFWLLKGRSHLKSQLAKRVPIDGRILPYHHHFLDFLKKSHKEGHPLYLATASHEGSLKSIVDYVGIFEGTFATQDHGVNLRSKAKAQVLCQTFGEKSFIYAGNSKDDLNVWKVSKKAIIVNPDRGVLEEAQKICEYFQIFPRDIPASSPFTLDFSPWIKPLGFLIIPLVFWDIFLKSPWLGVFCFYTLMALTHYIVQGIHKFHERWSYHQDHRVMPPSIFKISTLTKWMSLFIIIWIILSTTVIQNPVLIGGILLYGMFLSFEHPFKKKWTIVAICRYLWTIFLGMGYFIL
jgi:hypothetical protein